MLKSVEKNIFKNVKISLEQKACILLDRSKCRVNYSCISVE